MYNKPQGIRVQVGTESLQEFNRVHAALSEDAQSVEMQPEETFWAECFAMFTDKYGTPWMLNFDGKKAQG